MTLQANLDLIQTAGFDTLRGAVANGLHGMPPAWVKTYDQLVGLADQQPPPEALAPVGASTKDKADANMALLDWRAARDARADQLARSLGMDRAAIIEEYIGEALVDRVATFTAALDVIGPHAGKFAPDDQVVDAAGDSREFADAWLTYSSAASWYGPLRASWEILRRNDTATDVDPNGLASIFTEVRNVVAIRPDWRNLRAGNNQGGSYGFVADVWPTPVPARLAMILRAGGVLWLPSAVQQRAAYQAAKAADPTEPTPAELRRRGIWPNATVSTDAA